MIPLLLNLADWLALSVVLPSGAILNIGGHVFALLELAIFLVIYVIGGTRLAQCALCGLIGVSGVIGLFVLFLILQQFAGDSKILLPSLVGNVTPVAMAWLRNTAVRLVTLVTGMFTAAILYQGVRNMMPGIPRWLLTGVSLLVALWTNVAFFDVFAASTTQMLSKSC